jgi:DNA-binding CsgD family transcriptional regulator
MKEVYYVITPPPPNERLESLSPREREIFDLLLEGVSSKEIAYRLKISNSTVDFHRTKLYKKLGIQSLHELFAKYAASSKAVQPTATGMIPVNTLGFYSYTDMERATEKGKSTAKIFLTRNKIDGVNVDVLNLKTNLAKTKHDIHTAYADMHTTLLNQRLRKANGIRFKARGDGKPWQVEFHTTESHAGEIFFSYIYVFSTIRNQVINVDIPYSSIYLPDYWTQYKFDFDKEKIVTLSIGANFMQGYGKSLLQIFDFEIF